MSHIPQQLGYMKNVILLAKKGCSQCHPEKVGLPAKKYFFYPCLEPTDSELEESSFGIRTSIFVLKGCYDKPTPKITHKCEFGGEGVFVMGEGVNSLAIEKPTF